MKNRKRIAGILCWILLLYFFYEGICKVAYFQQFALWIRFAPLLKPVSGLLAYGLPVGELVLSFLFLFSSLRVSALYIAISGLLIYILWIMSVILFTHYVFTSYHVPWENFTWFQKMLVSLLLGWLAVIALVVLREGPLLRRFSKNALRNMPADAS